MADVHRLGDIGRAEINDYRAFRGGGGDERRVASEGGLQHGIHRIGPQSEIQKTRPRDFHRLAPFSHIELRHHVSSELARVHLPLLGKPHQCVTLEIAVLGIGAHAYKHAADVGFGQDRGGGGLQTGFDVPLDHSLCF
mgnify:CR=1 FL=1